MKDRIQQTSRHLVDPELLELIDQTPPLVLTEDGLPALRENSRAFPALEADPEALEHVEVMRRAVAGRAGDPDVAVALFVPRKSGVIRGAMLHIHGGGYVFGDAFRLIARYRKMALDLDCVIASVNYRLAPETRFPGAVEDCYAVLAWLVGEANALGIDPFRIGLLGESAGGGLAASLALLARDRRKHRLAFQHLIYPMIDDRTGMGEDPNPYAGEFIWTAEYNRFGWRSLLGFEPGTPNVSPYAAAARATELSGLPNTFISTGALDLFVDENIAYAHHLIRAGVPTELHVYPGAYHGFNFVAGAKVTQSAQRDSHAALRRALCSPC